MNALAALEAEIRRRQAELDTLGAARAVLASVAPPPKAAAAALRLTDQRKGKRKGGRGLAPAGAADGFEFEVNGVTVAVDERQQAAMELLAGAPDGAYVPICDIRALYDNLKPDCRRGMADLRQRLAPARAGIHLRRGPYSGFRLINLEG